MNEQTQEQPINCARCRDTGWHRNSLCHYCDRKQGRRPAPSPEDLRALWDYADNGTELDQGAARRLYLWMRDASGVE